MRIKDHMFPYPVLRDRSDDYVKTRFTVSAKSSVTDSELQLRFDMACTNPAILKLISNGQARYAVHMECQRTYFRQLMYSETPHFSLSIPNHLIDTMLEICPLIVAIADIHGFASDDLDEAYAGEPISFNCGDFIAVGNQFTVPITRKTDELKQLSSPFCVLAYPDGEEQKHMRLEYAEDTQVVIYVPKEVYPIIAHVQSERGKMDELHAALYFPALMQTIEFMRSHESEGCEDKHWYVAINQRAVEKGIGEISRSQEEAYVIAQKLFDFPLTRWLRQLPHSDDEE